MQEAPQPPGGRNCSLIAQDCKEIVCFATGARHFGTKAGQQTPRACHGSPRQPLKRLPHGGACKERCCFPDMDPALLGGKERDQLKACWLGGRKHSSHARFRKTTSGQERAEPAEGLGKRIF
jgi:hypothetical protein